MSGPDHDPNCPYSCEACAEWGHAAITNIRAGTPPDWISMDPRYAGHDCTCGETLHVASAEDAEEYIRWLVYMW
jgi:hypothetical protein